MSTNDKNIHDGHRKRLHKTLYEKGYEALSPYEQVEALLTYIFPRGDVNPLAHLLLEHFGTFSAVIDGGFQDLCGVKGLSEASSIKIKNLLELMKCYSDSKARNKIKLATKPEIFQLLEVLYRFNEVEETYIISISKNYICNGIRKIAVGSDDRVGIELKKVYRFIDSYRSSAVIIVHNHPEGNCSPSSNDIKAFEELNNAIRNYGCVLIDSYVIADDGIYSIRENTVACERSPVYCQIKDFVDNYRRNK